MDFKHETEIKDEILEFTEDDGEINHCLGQLLRNDELQEKNFLANITIKREIEVKDEPFDIVEAKDEFLGIEEEDSMIDELLEPSSAINENQVLILSDNESDFTLKAEDIKIEEIDENVSIKSELTESEKESVLEEGLLKNGVIKSENVMMIEEKSCGQHSKSFPHIVSKISLPESKKKN
ncbi:UNVERIFIED_CONTAM: hypothetical protein RMT77_006244 [Armadillidium vulgare]